MSVWALRDKPKDILLPRLAFVAPILGDAGLCIIEQLIEIDNIIYSTKYDELTRLLCEIHATDKIEACGQNRLARRLLHTPILGTVLAGEYTMALIPCFFKQRTCSLT